MGLKGGQETEGADIPKSELASSKVNRIAQAHKARHQMQVKEMKSVKEEVNIDQKQEIQCSALSVRWVRANGE